MKMTVNVNKRVKITVKHLVCGTMKINENVTQVSLLRINLIIPPGEGKVTKTPNPRKLHKTPVYKDAFSVKYENTRTTIGN